MSDPRVTRRQEREGPSPEVPAPEGGVMDRERSVRLNQALHRLFSGHSTQEDAGLFVQWLREITVFNVLPDTCTDAELRVHQGMVKLHHVMSIRAGKGQRGEA